MDLLLAVTLRSLMNKKTWVRFQHIVSDNSFSESSASTIYTLLAMLHATSKRSISERTLRVTMEAHVGSSDRRAELSTFIDNMMEVSKRDLKDAEGAVRRYLARGYGEQAVKLWLTGSSDAGFDYTVPAALMQRASSLVQVTDEPVISSRTVGLPGDADMERRAVGLGFSRDLDRGLLGGIGDGELGILLAPPARGKTSYLIAAATNAIRAGEHVLYFTLEIVKRKVFIRYFQTLTTMTYREMVEARELVDLTRKSVKGELYVADYSMARLTPSLIHAEIETQRAAGNPITYVVVDYAELMDPTQGFGRLGVTARTLGDMVKDLRRVAVQFNVPMLSAWQVNRGGSDKYTFLESDVSECWEMVKHADIILGLNQGPLELANNTLRIKVLKQRESPARPLVYLYSDMTRNIVRPLEDTEVPDGDTEAANDTALERGDRPGVQMYRGGAVAGRYPGGSGGSQERGHGQADPVAHVDNGALVAGDPASVDY